jgi:hypothetical protein
MPALRLLLACLVAPLCACIIFEDGSGETSEPPQPMPDEPPPPPRADCDPLVQDCPDGEACTLSDRDFVCIPVAVDGATGDPCFVASECGPGLLCVADVALAECDGGKCCTPLCDTGDPGVECPGAGEGCTALFTGPDVPLAIQSYGACTLPG